MYNFKETCKPAGTTVKSIKHGQNLALKPNYPLIHHNYPSALSIPSLNPNRDTARYSPLYIPPFHLQSQKHQEGPRWHLLSMVAIGEK